ncbi:hypothetical protein ACH36K_16070 [Clostridium sp. MB05]
MENLIILILISLLAESVWETLKMVWQNGKLSIDRIGALAIALLIAIGTRLDLLSLLGIETSIPYLGVVLTGILISRGSNFIHDLLAKVEVIKLNK